MTMTRADYVIIAEAIAKANEVWPAVTHREKQQMTSIVHTLAFALKNNNGRFDTMKFMARCKPPKI